MWHNDIVTHTAKKRLPIILSLSLADAAMLCILYAVRPMLCCRYGPGYMKVTNAMVHCGSCCGGGRGNAFLSGKPHQLREHPLQERAQRAAERPRQCPLLGHSTPGDSAYGVHVHVCVCMCVMVARGFFF